MAADAKMIAQGAQPFADPQQTFCNEMVWLPTTLLKIGLDT